MDNSKAPSKLRVMFPQLTPDQVVEAEASFDRYVAVTYRIFDRIKSDRAAYAEFMRLTASRKRSTISHDGMPPSNTP